MSYCLVLLRTSPFLSLSTVARVKTEIHVRTRALEFFAYYQMG